MTGSIKHDTDNTSRIFDVQFILWDIFSEKQKGEKQAMFLAFIRIGILVGSFIIFCLFGRFR